MNGQEKSDPAIVAVKSANKAGQPSAERMEPRVGAEGNAGQPHTDRTQSRAAVSPGLARIREAARDRKEERFTNLLHHVDVALLEQAYHWLKRDAAAGVDGVTWAQYGEDLADRLADLHGRVHRGSYRAQPSLRAYIPKPDGRQRPLGIASLEDKIVQRAVVEVLNAIYETDFLGFSYGFRPGRGQHDALDALAVGIESQAVNWIVDADILAFFDSIDHDWMMRFVEHRIGDRRVLRLIRKWLTVGVVEDDVRQSATKGTPQGAVITPRTQKVTFGLSASCGSGVPGSCLICVTKGNMCMSHGAIDRCAEVRTAECSAQLAGARDGYDRRGCVAVSSVRALPTPSIPLPSGGAGDRPYGARRHAVGADHAQDATQRRARCAGLFDDQRLDPQRDRHARDHGFPRSRTRAWLTDGRVGIGIKFSSITRSTVCSISNFSKSTSAWFPTRSGLLASVPR